MADVSNAAETEDFCIKFGSTNKHTVLPQQLSY